MKHYIQNFGRMKLAVVEETRGTRWIKTAAEVIDAEPSATLWDRLERTLRQAQKLVEAQ